MAIKSTFIINPVFQHCPNCGAGNTLHKSRRRNLKEKLINSLKLYKIYRCRQCGWRGYLSTFNFSALSVKAVLLYAGIIILIYILVTAVIPLLVKV
jgi:predicted RNA-binding Zn-ribbon protein involved in translation (DUF1610 family)